MISRDVILAVQRQSPFEPFVIHLTEGREIRAAHPDGLFVSPQGNLYHEADDGTITLFALEQITSITSKKRRKSAAK